MPTFQIPFTTPANYTYDPAKIEVAGGLAKLKENPVGVHAHWHLNESTGLVVPDSSGNGRDGNMINMTAIKWISGKLGNALNFDGANDYVDFGATVGDFQNNQPWTIECWFRTTSTNTQFLIAKQRSTGSARGYNLRSQNGFLQIRIVNTGGLVNGIAVNNTTQAINDGLWHHAVWTYDGSLTAAGNNLYIDNVLVPLVVAQDNLSATILNLFPFQLASRDGVNNPFTGDLDEVVVYERVLDAAEVAFRYNSGVGREDFLRFDDEPAIYKTLGDGDPALSSFSSFAETLGGENEGSVEYQLSTDGLDWKYWDGFAWTTAGAGERNSASVVNAQIGSFSVATDFVFVRAFLVSDGTEKVEVDLIEIDYLDNTLPNVNAGADKTTNKAEPLKIFSDATFSDPDGTVVQAFYRIPSQVPAWTEILQGAFPSLLAAVQDLEHTFIVEGVFDVFLKVVDNDGGEAADQNIVGAATCTGSPIVEEFQSAVSVEIENEAVELQTTSEVTLELCKL